MRTKGSQVYLDFGLKFANSITVDNEEARGDGRAVDCRGPNSIFAVLSLTIPNMVRITNNNGKVLKGAISEIELCKYLTKSGYVPYRHRSRVKGMKNMWTKGVQRWEHRFWVDPENADDLNHFRSKFVELQALYTPAYLISETKLLRLVSAISSSGSESAQHPTAGELCSTAQRVPRRHFATCRRCVFVRLADERASGRCANFLAEPAPAPLTFRQPPTAAGSG